MSAFADIAAVAPQRIWEGVAGRVVQGEKLTFAVVELDADSVIPEHSHDNEQVGVCVAGSLAFRIGDETRELGPGGTWRILAGIAHEVRTGPDGAVVIETFAPPRDDWETLERIGPTRPRWPE
jgi:quercetin dioxygenase-like cupin family protein